ncbi:hypothetical protein [Acetobacter orleanensis]|uniref:Uncharacterized protein n=1 Tax=Acetobacter orleanensis TaxID=104099 RepID=A0A4Y3TN32_9PROT|nr:hypothetical protein [Acetobacter orleanensis]KXV62586.1 hypothetical protein AD949_10800 [Acetobacter orleanensis]PCD79968.1 hypothetical protein CO710_03665 [Acetobacter orleanensis]GAN68278.1 hypothetical protein Abol_015_117 [Acetobacter orleanensis JCM 7639]GBR31156.1 hypothetical protein AA0473_2462 [Acetobacter orleanensis NRIC 0473]GEB82829.1 hypothetical protein AOR01nite_13060 [Acetobacter orleanensis]
MQDNRCATAEEVALLRERVARVEGGHDHLRDGLDTLSRQFSDLRRDLTQAVAENAARTRHEIMSRVDEMGRDAQSRDAEVSDRLARIEGGIRLANWATLACIALATGLLGWAQIGDAVWKVLLSLAGMSS